MSVIILTSVELVTLTTMLGALVRKRTCALRPIPARAPTSLDR
ncbi:hypothetical protein [Ilumatobacter sp.]